MFCPRCSQEQISEETKFCSRCGLPLGLVSEILTNGGFLSIPNAHETKTKRKLFTRKNGLIFSLFWFIFFAMMLTPIFGGAVGDDAGALVFAIIGIMGGIILAIASFAFLNKTPKNYDAFNRESANYQTQNLYAANQSALPPQQTQPVQSYVSPANSWRAPDTGEMVQPQSVTEVTTRLLRKEE
jgi:hypothetical protein